jgi:hypothetical protein
MDQSGYSEGERVKTARQYRRHNRRTARAWNSVDWQFAGQYLSCDCPRVLRVTVGAGKLCVLELRALRRWF